jgi:hypothetical protein
MRATKRTVNAMITTSNAVIRSAVDFRLYRHEDTFFLELHDRNRELIYEVKAAEIMSMFSEHIGGHA